MIQTNLRATTKWLRGLPAWETAKGNCRSLSPDVAVEECARLSSQYHEMRMAKSFKIDLEKVLSSLRTKKIPFVLTGAHGIATWTGRPRATHDVDILVRAGRNQARAVKAIQEIYPHLEVRNLAGVSALFLPGTTESVIDVTFPHRADQEFTLQTGIWVGQGTRKYRIPTLEAALANKYGAMLTLSRDHLKRAQDAVDFATMVKHSSDDGRTPVDLEQLESLGEKVWPGGGGKEILYLVEQAKAGKVPNVGTDDR